MGEGAFGAVWKARDTQLERIVAVKIPRHTQLDAEDIEKFIRAFRHDILQFSARVLATLSTSV